MVDGHSSRVHPVSFRTRKLILLTFLSVLWCASPWEHRIAVNQPLALMEKKRKEELLMQFLKKRESVWRKRKERRGCRATPQFLFSFIYLELLLFSFLQFLLHLRYFPLRVLLPGQNPYCRPLCRR